MVYWSGRDSDWRVTAYNRDQRSVSGENVHSGDSAELGKSLSLWLCCEGASSWTCRVPGCKKKLELQSGARRAMRCRARRQDDLRLGRDKRDYVWEGMYCTVSLSIGEGVAGVYGGKRKCRRVSEAVEARDSDKACPMTSSASMVGVWA